MLTLEQVQDLIHRVDFYLDDGCSQEYKDQPMAQDMARVAKLMEEGGEAMDAFIGLTGQNARKGFYGDKDHLLFELADCALTGVYAIQHFTKDTTLTMQILLARLQVHALRLAQAAA